MGQAGGDDVKMPPHVCVDVIAAAPLCCAVCELIICGGPLFYHHSPPRLLIL